MSSHMEVLSWLHSLCSEWIWVHLHLGLWFCGQLALGQQCIATAPTNVKELSKVKKVICGRTHNAAIEHKNILYTGDLMNIGS